MSLEMVPLVVTETERTKSRTEERIAVSDRCAPLRDDRLDIHLIVLILFLFDKSTKSKRSNISILDCFRSRVHASFFATTVVDMCTSLSFSYPYNY